MNSKISNSLSGLALSALLFAPVSGFAQSILLTAGNFAALAGTALTSAGTAGTIIFGGDVGGKASVTGFPPAQVIGGSLLPSGSVVDQGVTDLITAAAGLAGMAPTANLSGLNLGGLTLTPGVYRFDSAALLGGGLTLDAQGQNNAFWVFQIGSALTTTANASVSFVNPGSNGGGDVGVFWNAGSGITFGADNHMLGNYLAGTSIAIGSASSGSARMLAQAGVSLDNDQISPYGGPGGADWTGGLVYGPGGAVVAVTAIPEPSTTAAIVGLGMLALAFVRRRSATIKRAT